MDEVKKLTGKELGEEISSMINGRGSEVKAMFDVMLNDHRFLNNEFNIAILKYLADCTTMYESGRYDGRNEQTMKDIADMMNKSGLVKYYYWRKQDTF